MLFFALLLVAAALAVLTFWYWVVDEGEWVVGSIFTSLVALVGAFVAFALTCLVGYFVHLGNGWHDTNERTVQLRALGTSSQLEGRSYFLGGGYIKDKRVLSYISQSDNGGSRLATADASDSVVYEGASSPHVVIRDREIREWWLAPFAIDSFSTYEFHVPEGAVVENYELSAK